MNPGILIQLLDALKSALAPGLGALRPYMLAVFTFLAFLELTRVAAGMALGARNVPQMVIRFCLRSGILLWLLLDYPTVVNAVYTSFVELGLIAGGNSLTVAQFLDPGTYMATGLRTGAVLLDSMKGFSFLSTSAIATAIMYGAAWVFFLIAYAVMAVSVFILQIEFTVTIMAAVVMLPFAVLPGTSFIAQGAVSYPINVGFRFFVQALLASAVFPLIRQITTPEPSLEAAFIMVLAAWVMAFLFWKGPSIAAGILSGVPSLSAGQVLAAAAGTAAVAGAGVGLISAGVAGSGAALGAGARGVTAARAALTGAGRSGQQLGFAWAPRAVNARQVAPALAASRQGVGSAFHTTLSQASKYFSHDQPSGGTHAHLS